MSGKMQATMEALADAVSDKGVIAVVGEDAQEEAAKRLRLGVPASRDQALYLYRRNPAFKWIVDAVAKEMLHERDPDMTEEERRRRVLELREQMMARCDVPPEDAI